MVEFKKGNTASKDVKFKPGVSGNPKGRPRGKAFKTVLKELSEKKIAYKDLLGKSVNMTLAEAVATALYNKGLFNVDTVDVSSLKTIMEHVDGKTIAIVGDEDNPPILKIIHEIVDSRCPQEQDGYSEPKLIGQDNTDA